MALDTYCLHVEGCTCKLLLMTTLHVVDDEPLPVAVARRLREVLAGMKLSQKQFGELTGWGRGYVYQRYSGNTPLDVADLEHIQQKTGIQVDFLMREEGPRYVPPGSGGDDGGAAGAPSRARTYDLRIIRSDDSHQIVQPEDLDDLAAAA